MSGAALLTKASAALPPAAGQGGGTPVEQLVLPLINVGAVGAVLAWFMLRNEARLTELAGSIDRFRHALNRFAMAHLLEVATREDAPPVVKKQAEALLDEIKAEQAQTGGKREGFMP